VASYAAPGHFATSLRFILRLCTGLGLSASAFVAVRLTLRRFRNGHESPMCTVQ